MEWMKSNSLFISLVAAATGLISAATGILFQSGSLHSIEIFAIAIMCPAYGYYIIRSIVKNRAFYVGLITVNSEGCAPYGTLNYLSIIIAVGLLLLPIGLTNT